MFIFLNKLIYFFYNKYLVGLSIMYLVIFYIVEVLFQLYSPPDKAGSAGRDVALPK